MSSGSPAPAFPRLVLASASPRRRELLALLGIPFEVVPSRYEEPTNVTEPTSLPEFVTTLAGHKAEEVASRLGDVLALGADTIVTVAEGDYGVPLGKPVDAEDARRMLRLLSGRVHTVYTGVALVRARDGRTEPQAKVAVATQVRFRPLNETMISDYIATDEPFDKAGAYGAQGYAAPFIEGFEGDFFNVVGLPICTVGRLLEQIGVDWWRRRERPHAVLE